MGTIFYRDMVKQIHECDHERSSKTFSLTYIPCDRKRRTGGQWVTKSDVQKCGLPYHCLDNEMLGIMEPNGKVTPVHLKLIFVFNDLNVTP